MTTPAIPTSTPAPVDLAEQVAQLTDTVTAQAEMLALAQEDLAGMYPGLYGATASAARLLHADDLGWAKVGTLADDTLADLPRDFLDTEAARARIAGRLDALIGRGIRVRTGYVWGQGCTITAADKTVNDVVQGFLDDNEATFAGALARENRERDLATTGSHIISLVTSPLTGRVQVRVIPRAEITDIITVPGDAARPMLYRRSYAQTVRELTTDGTWAARTEARVAWYPAADWTPPKGAARPLRIEGAPVEWDKPVAHLRVNSAGSWGVPDVLSALKWAAGYSEFLLDSARLAKSLARYAYQVTAKDAASAKSVRAQLAMPTVGPSGPAGGTAVSTETLSPVSKAGAMIDPGVGRPFAAMVAAALDLPVTMVLADPGVTGARATAETLDLPNELVLGLRRRVHAEFDRHILGYVIREAVRAPRGALSGSIIADEVTGRERVTLADAADPTVQITFPDMSTDPMDTVVAAACQAVELGLMAPVDGARIVLGVLGVDDVDEALERLLDEDGEWVNRFEQARDAAAARSALDAVIRTPMTDAPNDDEAAPSGA